jgi:hypothetical protein
VRHNELFWRGPSVLRVGLRHNERSFSDAFTALASGPRFAALVSGAQVSPDTCVVSRSMEKHIRVESPSCKRRGKDVTAGQHKDQILALCSIRRRFQKLHFQTNAFASRMSAHPPSSMRRLEIPFKGANFGERRADIRRRISSADGNLPSMALNV